MSLNLLVLTGAHAAEKAAELRAADSNLIVVKPPYYTDSDKLFRSRLCQLLVAATSGRRTLLVEPRPLTLPAPAQRMLERVALGYGVRLYGSRPWLAPLAGHTPALGSPFRLGVLLPSTLDAVWDQMGAFLRHNPVPAGYGLGVWPTGLASAPPVLLVGDRPSSKWPASRPAWPFISAMRSGCSWWLAEQLERAGIPENRLFWVDSADRDGNPLRLPAEPWQANFGGVFALGKNAAEWCWNNGWRFEQVHHPQFWHRFQPGKTYQLTKLLYRKGDKFEAKSRKSSA